MNSANFSLLAIRVCLGLSLAMHGYGHFFRGGKIQGTGRWFASLGMKPGIFHAWLASLTEFVAGFGFALGLLTPFDAAGFVGLLFVAVWLVHRHNGFFVLKEGWEYVTMMMVVAVCVGGLGPGEWSLDHVLKIDDNLDGKVGLLIGAGLGLASAIGTLVLFYRPEPKADSAAS